MVQGYSCKVCFKLWDIESPCNHCRQNICSVVAYEFSEIVEDIGTQGIPLNVIEKTFAVQLQIHFQELIDKSCVSCPQVVLSSSYITVGEDIWKQGIPVNFIWKAFAVQSRIHFQESIGESCLGFPQGVPSSSYIMVGEDNFLRCADAKQGRRESGEVGGKTAWRARGAQAHLYLKIYKTIRNRQSHPTPTDFQSFLWHCEISLLC